MKRLYPFIFENILVSSLFQNKIKMNDMKDKDVLKLIQNLSKKSSLLNEKKEKEGSFKRYFLI